MNDSIKGLANLTKVDVGSAKYKRFHTPTIR